MDLPASATIEQAAALARGIDQALDQHSAGAALRIDASALSGFDTSLLAVLLHARRQAQRAGRGFELVGAPEKLGQLARLYGVEDLLSLGQAAAAAATEKAGPSGT